MQIINFLGKILFFWNGLNLNMNDVLSDDCLFLIFDFIPEYAPFLVLVCRRFYDIIKSTKRYNCEHGKLYLKKFPILTSNLRWEYFDILAPQLKNKKLYETGAINDYFIHANRCMFNLRGKVKNLPMESHMLLNLFQGYFEDVHKLFEMVQFREAHSFFAWILIYLAKERKRDGDDTKHLLRCYNFIQPIKYSGKIITILSPDIYKIFEKCATYFNSNLNNFNFAFPIRNILKYYLQNVKWFYSSHSHGGNESYMEDLHFHIFKEFNINL